MTNFHLPRSTLFMLVSAFCGLETMRAAYAHAIAERLPVLFLWRCQPAVQGDGMIVRYLTHPQVAIDPSVPVERWGLNAVGSRRVAALAASDALRGTRVVISSGETKAIDTAAPLAAALGVEHRVREGMHENDRSATGFLPPAEFEQVADQFFAAPEKSVRGWERAVDAQTRIVRETLAALAEAPAGDVLLVGHGAVGTLLDVPSGRLADRPQPRPTRRCGGNVFAFERDGLRLLHGWAPMETIRADEAQAT